MPTAIDVANYVKPEIVPVYKYEAEIDITPQGPARTWAPLCAGFNNISEAMNETIQQYSFLCGKGLSVNYVTGMAPSMTFAGQRVVGDPAQDYIFAQKYSLMSARDTHFRLTRTAENGTKSVLSANVTFANLSDVSGNTTEGSAISVEMRFNGAPFAGDAWASASTAYIITQNLNNINTSNAPVSVAKNGSFTTTLTAATGYSIASVIVTMGGVDVTATAYTPGTGVVSIASVTGNVIITAYGSPAVYTITNTLTKCSNSNPAATANYGDSYSAVLTEDAGYTFSSVAVTMGGTDITSTAYDNTDDSITIASVTGNIVITATAT